MKTIKINAWGELPLRISKLVEQFSDSKADKDTIETLDNEISFIVCDLRIAHGNLNKYDNSAWLSPRNDNSWHVRISF
jgi:hypothetical protein